MKIDILTRLLLHQQVMMNDDFLALANHIVPLEVTANMRSLQQLQFGNTRWSVMLMTFDSYDRLFCTSQIY